MKKYRGFNLFLFVLIFTTSCSPISTFKTKIISTPTATITGFMQTPVWPNIEPYNDVRFMSVSSSETIMDRKFIETLVFNESTIWSEKNKSDAQDIMEIGKNPGLGVRALHELGVTGKGVNIAIIDQNMVLDHPEFSGKVIKYMDFGTEAPVTEGSMHAPAVTSLLVGTSVGTAPDASIYFAAVPSWKLDAQYYADALNWVIDENSKLPEANKIRLVSISAIPSGPGSPFTKNNDAWDVAYERAVDAGILVLDCTENHGITALCYLDLDNPDDVSGCTPGLPGLSNIAMPNRIYIPTSRRTVAEEYSQGNPSYQYTGIGGLSWSIPYLAGVLAMGWQVNPELSNTQIIDLLFESAYTNGDGVKIINPPAFIELVKKSLD